MSRPLICLGAVVLLPGSGVWGATTVDLMPTLDVEIGGQPVGAHGPSAVENTVGQMYLKINGTKAAYAGAADDLKAGLWMPWSVDLSSLGLNLKSIKTLGIGIEGAGAVGMLFVDDIQLQP